MRNLAALLAIAVGFLAAPVAQAVPITYVAKLDQNEPVPTGSPGTGTVFVTIDTDQDTLAIAASWSGLFTTLSTGTTIAHIHCCTAAPLTGAAGVAVDQGTLPGFPVSVFSGSYSVVVDLADANSYGNNYLATAGSIAAAEAQLAAGLANGTAYFNIHTSRFPGGEIRGFFVVPEPAGLALLGLGLLGLGLSRKFMR